MAFDSKPAKTPVLPSEKGTSDPQDAQLFPSGRVDSDVSSIAIDRGVLAMGGGPRQPQLAVEAGVSGELTDAQVMLKVKAGDDSAFDYLVQKYRRPMMSFMYRMAHNAAVAEDLAQEVFLRVYRSRQTYAASAKFTTWLYRIATNLAVNHARDTKHERPENTVNIDEPDTETGMTVDVPDLGLNAEQSILRRERMQAIRQRVEALPERQRMAVIMHKYQGLD